MVLKTGIPELNLKKIERENYQDFFEKETGKNGAEIIIYNDIESNNDPTQNKIVKMEYEIYKEMIEEERKHRKKWVIIIIVIIVVVVCCLLLL